MGISTASAQSPREQLSIKIKELGASPSNAKLREEIIALQKQIKPPPAVPEPALAALARGNAALKEASSASGYQRAIAAFEDSVRTAPWWADAYYNLSLAQEAAGKFDDAIASLRFYLLAAPPGTDTSAANRRLGGLEVKKATARSQSFEGFWVQYQFQHIETKQWTNKDPGTDHLGTIMISISKNSRGDYVVNSLQNDPGYPDYVQVVADRNTIQWWDPEPDKQYCSSTPCGNKLACRRIGEREMECLFHGMGFREMPGGVVSPQRYRRFDRCWRAGYKKDDTQAVRCQ